MGASYQDTFSGSGSLGGSTIEIGGVDWSVLAGTWSRSGGLATPSTLSVASSLIAVVDVSNADVDIRINVSTGGGDCIYFRVTDANNWWRLRVRNEPSELSLWLETSTSGTVATIGSARFLSLGGPLTTLRVVAIGSTISAYANERSQGTWVRAAFNTVTSHGIGRGGPSTNTASAIDNFTLQPLNRAPNAPTLLLPVGGVTIDDSIAQRFSWAFSDLDPGDSQSKATLYYRLTSDTSWTSVTVAGPNNFTDIPAATLADGDYEWQVETYDASGSLGARSGSSFFTAAAAPVGPVFTSPTNGSTIASPVAVFEWSVTDQDAYQLRSVADDSGVADPSTVYQDSGEVDQAATRSARLDFDTSGRTEHVQIRVKVGTLWSDWTDSTHPVSYTSPAVPLIVVAADSTTASITVDITQPTPSGDEPDVVSADVYRRVIDATTGLAIGTAIRVATLLAANATWTDYTPASSTAYQYQAVAIAANGTATPSRWGPGNAASSATTGIYDTSTYDSATYD